MKRTPNLWVAAAILVLATLAWAKLDTSWANPAVKHDLIIMRCDVKSSGFAITSYSASTSAPAKKTDNCAEMLSNLHRDGFAVVEIGYFDVEGGYMVYTLGR